MNILIWVIGVPLCLVIAFIAGWFVKARLDLLRRKSAEEEAKKIIEEANNAAETLKKECLLELRDDHLKRKTLLENDYEAKRAELNRLERKVTEQERALAQKAEHIEKRNRELKVIERDLRDLKRIVDNEQETVANRTIESTRKLEQLAGMTHDDALNLMRQELIDRAKQDTAEMIKDIRDQARLQANREAKEIVVQAIQRSAADHSAETTVTVVNIPNEEVKGRIIGREGRNIRSFEAVTGVELIIDDTPEAVTLSCFDPLRREVARMTLEQLITDGRIHPARIEEVVKRAQHELDERLIQLGQQACDDTGVDGLHPELIRHLGKLHYRTSYGQNVLQHSIEVAGLAALMAVQLGLDTKLAARAGLLHDIGKAIDRDTEGTHTELGAELAKRFHEPKAVINAISLHHDDVEAKSLIACLVQAADAISGARPGARRDSLENYIKRLSRLENIAGSFAGVSKTFALQAGREIRVMVEHDKVNDAQAESLAADIARRVQDELEYPGQIKVTIIREFRAIEFAR